MTILIFIVEDFPVGFPRVACYMDSDDAFPIYRRFGYVFSRLLLHKQDELSSMEATLRTMDNLDHKTPGCARYLQSRTLDNSRKSVPWAGSLPEAPGSRTELLERMEKKTMEYG